MNDPKPDASRVAEVLLRQQDPANWSKETWAANAADLCELRNHCGKYCTEVHLGMTPDEFEEHHQA